MRRSPTSSRSTRVWRSRSGSCTRRISAYCTLLMNSGRRTMSTRPASIDTNVSRAAEKEYAELMPHRQTPTPLHERFGAKSLKPIFLLILAVVWHGPCMQIKRPSSERSSPAFVTSAKN